MILISQDFDDFRFSMDMMEGEQKSFRLKKGAGRGAGPGHVLNWKKMSHE